MQGVRGYLPGVIGTVGQREVRRFADRFAGTRTDWSEPAATPTNSTGADSPRRRIVREQRRDLRERLLSTLRD